MRKTLEHPRIPYWVAALAFMLALPTVWSGWALDDHLLRMVMLGPPYSSFEPMDLFGIPDGDPEAITRYRDQGILPFWAPSDFRIAFFRPLTVFTAWLDFQLWPDSPALMHLHSVLWFAGLVLAAGLLYRSTAGAMWICGLAALLNGLDPARALPVAWISNRHVLISTLFGVLTLLVYDRWRSRQWKPGSVLAPCLFTLALLAGEMALATVCYLLAYAFFLDRAPWRSRVRALIPCVCVLAVWFLVYSAFNFGTSGSGTYTDPRDDPVGFLGSFVVHAPLLLVSEVTSIPADLATLVPTSHPGVLLPASLILMFLMVLVLLPVMRARGHVRFWASGMLLSLVPVAATLPSGRLLSFVALGAGPLIAHLSAGLTERAWFAKPSIASHRVVRGFVILLLAIKLVVAPLVIPLAGWLLHSINTAMIAAIRTIPTGDGIAKQELVILNPPDHLYYAAYLFAVNKLEGRPTPLRLRVLAAGPTEMVVSRVDANVLRARMPGGLFSGPYGRSFRSKSAVLQSGETIRISGLESTVLDVNTGGDPTTMIYRFARPLEDDRLRWLRWQNGVGYVLFVPPEIGDSISLPRSQTLTGIF